MIERAHIQLLRVMSGYSVRGSFTHQPAQVDEPHGVTVYHGWLTPTDQEDDRVVLEDLATELFNLAPRWRGPWGGWSA